MKGEKMSEWEEEEEPEDRGDEKNDDAPAGKERKSRHGTWESGKGRCPVTGRRVLGGTSGVRRIMV